MHLIEAKNTRAPKNKKNLKRKFLRLLQKIKFTKKFLTFRISPDALAERDHLLAPNSFPSL
jgi:hypothetical protein